jgi:hypothetical protein
VVRDVTGVGRRAPVPRPGPPGRRKLPLLQLRDGEVAERFEDLGEISRRDLVAQQLLDVTQLVMGTLAQGELNAERLGRQRLDTITPDRECFILKYP